METSVIKTLAKALYAHISDELKQYKKYTWNRLSGFDLSNSVSCHEFNDKIEEIRLKDTLSEAEQLLLLRTEFAALWAKTDNLELRIEMAKFIISQWGGIKRNSDKTIKTYASSSPDNLCSSIKGISSKSKLLAAIDPKNYFVYDSRLYVYLNQFVESSSTCRNLAVYFPKVPGWSRTAKNYVITNKTTKKRFSYCDYCQLIKEVGVCSQKDFQDFFNDDRLQFIEMTLYRLSKE